MTDEEGKFALEGLDPELLFQLLAYERGHVPTFSEGWLDPRVDQAELALEANDLDRRPPELVLRGRVVDTHGRPVARASLEPVGRILEGGGRRYGALEGVDVLALTDADGRFALGVSTPGDALLLSVDAAGHAARLTGFLPAGPEEHLVQLTRGVRVTGVVVQDGQPLPGVELGMVQQDRDGERFTGERLIGTDAAGRFTFVNIGPDQTWNLYGKMASFGTRGGLSPRAVRVGADGSTVDLGPLEVGPSVRLSGRVVLSDGAALPEGRRALLGSEEAWDSQTVLLGPDGSFAFEGLPHGLYTLGVRVSGYVVSPRNASHDFLNQSGLLGRIDGDVEDLVLMLDPGPEPSPQLDRELFARYEALRSSPLRGAPPTSIPQGER